MWLENDESVIMGDNIMSATSDVQSTSLSDDIELGAVWNTGCSACNSRHLFVPYN